MSAPLYVPALPTRRHATAAYRALTPDVQRLVAPLWTLPPRPGVPTRQLAERIIRDAGDVTAAQRHGPAWLDAPFADDADAAVLADALPPEWWDHRNLRPVTGPGRPSVQQSLALAVARRHQGGLGIRVRLPGEWSDRTALDVDALLGRLPTGHPADLFLDLGTVLPDRPDAAKDALRALDALVPLTSWCSVTVLAGGFPEPPDDFREGIPYEAPRTDWETWHEIRHSERAYLPLLRYGDYGIHPATYVAQTPSARNGGAPWGVLRYTTARSYHLAKVPYGRQYDDTNRQAARCLTGLAGFRGAGTGAGERWLRDRERGATDTGNHGTWNRVGNVQHMTFLVTCFGERGR
ncbi:beta family protein [Streptomyces actinomycinicus]|uniref:Beta family protein n=1 Tax=Streptomyces actinomycinicus TaxID=1695166 RepID=A0A937JLZ4_9ACTN|nr:beta family protein [Streptomyces actinomycinicus]MBL1084174.1 beta family protein [Streptomyces actinomycinicus]